MFETCITKLSIIQINYIYKHNLSPFFNECNIHVINFAYTNSAELIMAVHCCDR